MDRIPDQVCHPAYHGLPWDVHGFVFGCAWFLSGKSSRLWVCYCRLGRVRRAKQARHVHGLIFQRKISWGICMAGNHWWLTCTGLHYKLRCSSVNWLNWLAAAPLGPVTASDGRPLGFWAGAWISDDPGRLVQARLEAPGAWDLPQFRCICPGAWGFRPPGRLGQARLQAPGPLGLPSMAPAPGFHWIWRSQDACAIFDATRRTPPGRRMDAPGSHYLGLFMGSFGVLTRVVYSGVYFFSLHLIHV
jgi:hypothetical protein